MIHNRTKLEYLRMLWLFPTGCLGLVALTLYAACVALNQFSIGAGVDAWRNGA